MLGKFARSMALVTLALLVAAYAFSSGNKSKTPPVSGGRTIDYLFM